MAKKAILDILSVSIDEGIEDTLPKDDLLEKDEGIESIDQASGRNLLSKISDWVRKPLFWIILMSVVLLGVIAGAFIRGDPEKAIKGPVDPKEQSLSGSPNQAKDKMVFLEGFVVDQKDEKGNIRIAFCDIALELEKIQAADVLSDRIDVRNVVHTVLKRKKAEEGLLPEGRTRLKEELRGDLNGLLGENRVKSVYFTRYELN